MAPQQQKAFPFELLMAWIRPYQGPTQTCMFQCDKQAAYLVCDDWDPLAQGGIIDMDALWNTRITEQRAGIYHTEKVQRPLCTEHMEDMTLTLLIGLDPRIRQQRTAGVRAMIAHQQKHGYSLAICSTIHSPKDEGDTWATTAPNTSLEDVVKYINDPHTRSMPPQG